MCPITIFNKKASSNFPVHRLLNFPLSKESIEQGRKHIKDVVRIHD